MILNILWGIPKVLSIGTMLLKVLLLIFILGVIILVHEFGHFIWAKKFGVHIYEFSIGMGPLLATHKGKDGINYNIRWIPIGGYVSMAGEVYDDDDKIDKSELLCNKPWWQRLIIMVAGVVNNFLLTLVLLFIYGAIWGGEVLTPVIDSVVEDTPASTVNFKSKDRILEINGYHVNSWDKAQIIMLYKSDNDYYTFKVEHDDGKRETIQVTPEVVKDGDVERRVFGINLKVYEIKNVWNVIVFGFRKFASTFSQMVYTIWGLIIGKISLDSLSGPVGMYTVVGQTFGLSIGYAIKYIIYLVYYISTNVGLINILPFPAFDGGHVLFILIEKIKGSPVNSKIENTCHLIGFILIFLLMIIVTINDIIKLF